MATSYVKPENRKRRYVTRSATYYVQRITDPMEYEPKGYRSVTAMCENLALPKHTVRKFLKSGNDSQYVYSKTGVLYMLRKPVYDVAIAARCAEEGPMKDEYQEFTSGYQLVRRFKVSFTTVSQLKRMQPIGVECKKTIYDEFKRRWYLTFYR